MSDVPALVVAGAFDPITPDDRSEAVASRLPNATYGFLVTGGHGVSGHPCVEQIELAFLDDPTTPPDTSCLDTVEPVTFL